MASKSKHKTKGLGADPSLGKLGQRMLNTMLREERIAERDLQEKLKAISEKEHKTMVRLGCDSLDLRHDLTLQRSKSPLPWERENSFDSLEGVKEESDCDKKSQSSSVRQRLGCKAMSMLTYTTKNEPEHGVAEFKGMNSEETKNNNNDKLPWATSPSIVVQKHNESRGKNNDLKINHLSLTDTGARNVMTDIVSESSTPKSPRLLQRRPVSDIGCCPIKIDDNNDGFLIEQIPLSRKGASRDKHVPKPPSTPPPVRINLSSLSANTGRPRPSSARTPRSRTPVRGGGSCLDLPQHMTVQRHHPRSPSPARLTPDMTMANLGRRGSAPPKIDASVLPTTSVLCKAFDSDVNQNLRPGSPEALRKHISSTDEELKDRVLLFLKSLQNK